MKPVGSDVSVRQRGKSLIRVPELFNGTVRVSHWEGCPFVPASACLRILLDLSDEKLAKLDALGPLVTKVTRAFLEGRWPLPRRYVSLTPYSFMLTDPNADTLDVARLEKLAAELQTRLFGSSESGDVTLLLHDGDDEATARFVTMDHATLKKVTQDTSQAAPFSGKLMKISTEAASGKKMGWEAIEYRGGRVSESSAPGWPSAIFHGVYLRVSQCFVGSGVSAVMPSGMDYSLFGGADQLPGENAVDFDMRCVDVAVARLAGPPLTGALFLPVSYSSVMRPATRECYEEGLGKLPADKRFQLVAVVYDVPRLPARHTYAHLRDLLDPHFAQIDLQISDPGFDLELVPTGAINTVTLRLPDGGEMVRSAAIRRFFEKRQLFKRQNISPAFTNVRTKSELEACLRPPISYVSGRAVCSPLTQPVGNLPCPESRLPLIGSL
jgi:hypothetical protein